jgi:transposase InsO family protein
MNTDMVMAALNQAIADRNNRRDVIHHSVRGVQYLSIRYTDKMTDSGVIASVGTTGDSYDNALAETVKGLYKSEVIHYLKQNWTGVNDVELAPLNGWTGSIKPVCTARLVMCHPLSLKSGIMIIYLSHAKLPDSSKSPSDKVGAVQFLEVLNIIQTVHAICHLFGQFLDVGFVSHCLFSC